MPYVKVLRHGQITIPKEYRKALGIDEGHILEAKKTSAGVLLKPKALVDKGSVLSAKGEKKVATALKAYKNGDTKKFKSANELIKELKK